MTDLFCANCKQVFGQHITGSSACPDGSGKSFQPWSQFSMVSTINKLEADVSAAQKEASVLRIHHSVLLSAAWFAAGSGGLNIPQHILSLEGKTVIMRQNPDGSLVILREKPASIEIPGAVSTKDAVDQLRAENERLRTENTRLQDELEEVRRQRGLAEECNEELNRAVNVLRQKVGEWADRSADCGLDQWEDGERVVKEMRDGALPR